MLYKPAGSILIITMDLHEKNNCFFFDVGILNCTQP